MSDVAKARRWERLVSYLNAGEDPLSLALARIVICTTVATHVVRLFASGAAELAFLDHARGGMSETHGWLEALGGPEPSTLYALGAITLLASTAGALGLFTRPALLVTWLSMRALSSLNTEAQGSYDALIVDILFVLMLSGASRTLSLDARRKPEPRRAARWPRILLVAQMGFLYLGSGLHKGSSGWVPGGDASALWYILQQPTWSRLGELPLRAYPLTQIATTLVWFFEVGSPLFVLAFFLRETAPRGRVLAALKRGLDRIRFLEIYLAIGLAMHVGIELTMEVGPFSFASLALYPAAIAPERLRGWIDRARRRRPAATETPSDRAKVA
jgi:uncharacterized membrane protein YphA (DoxX/SURF4 family)